MFLSTGFARGAAPHSLELPKDAVPAPVILFTFDRDPVGALPAGLEVPRVDAQRAESWGVQELQDAPSPRHVLGHRSKGGAKESSAMLLLSGARDHGELALQFKTLSTEDDQTLGFVFHYVDAQNYTLIAVSTKDDKGSLYQVKKGKRKLVDSLEVLAAPYRWHELRLVFTDTTYTALLNHELLLGGKTKRLETPGAMGIFAASNTTVAFDNFQASR